VNRGTFDLAAEGSTGCPRRRRSSKGHNTDATLSLANAKTNCSHDPKAMEMIEARERDLDKIVVILNVEKPR
jgi:hypothetical protein